MDWRVAISLTSTTCMASGSPPPDPPEPAGSRLSRFACDLRTPPEEFVRAFAAWAFLMAFESILFGLPKSSDGEIAELKDQPGIRRNPGRRRADEQRPRSPRMELSVISTPARTTPPTRTNQQIIIGCRRSFLNAPAGSLSPCKATGATRISGSSSPKPLSSIKSARHEAGVEQAVQTYTGLPVGLPRRSRYVPGAPFFFRVEIELPGPDPVKIQKQKAIATALIELQKPRTPPSILGRS